MKRRSPFVHFLFFVGLVALLLAANWGLGWLNNRGVSFYNSYVEDVLLRAGIYVTLAVSLNLVNGFTGQFSIGHAGLFGVGAYTGALVACLAQATFLSHFVGPDANLTWFNGGVLLVISMLSGGVVAALLGWLIGQPSLKLRGDYLAIVTLGFNQIIVVVLNSIDYVGAARGFSGISVGQQQISVPMLTSFFWVYLVAALAIILSINLRRSVQGLAFLSVREDEIAAEAMGVPTTRIKVTAFVIAAFFAGVAGSLFAHEQGFFKPDNFNFITSINIVVMVVLGGMGSVSGAAIGALLLIIIPEQLHVIDQYRLVIYALLLIVLMLVRPKGIFGSDELSRSWIAKQWEGLKTLPGRVSGRA
jgi:branched-chain amino acid transport system permease protein